MPISKPTKLSTRMDSLEMRFAAQCEVEGVLDGIVHELVDALTDAKAEGATQVDKITRRIDGACVRSDILRGQVGRLEQRIIDLSGVQLDAAKITGRVLEQHTSKIASLQESHKQDRKKQDRIDKRVCKWGEDLRALQDKVNARAKSICNAAEAVNYPGLKLQVDRLTRRMNASVARERKADPFDKTMYEPPPPWGIDVEIFEREQQLREREWERQRKIRQRKLERERRQESESYEQLESIRRRLAELERKAAAEPIKLEPKRNIMGLWHNESTGHWRSDKWVQPQSVRKPWYRRAGWTRTFVVGAILTGTLIAGMILGIYLVTGPYSMRATMIENHSHMAEVI